MIMCDMFFLAQPFASRLARPQNPRTFKAMSLIHELSRATAKAQRAYDLETERLVQPLVARVKGKFTKACRKAARNRENKSWMEVCLTEEVDCRDGGIDVTEQKLQAMLLELGFHDGRVKWDSFSECFSVSAKWPVADATGPKEPSPERAGGTCITCTICQEHCPAVVLMPCGHVVCRDCQHCQQLRQCPMCRGPVSSASDGLFMD